MIQLRDFLEHVPTMNPTVKAAWVADLRNPLVHQSCSTLMDDNGYCCLGVCMKVQGTDPTTYFEQQIEDDETDSDIEDLLVAAVMPQQFWAGLDANTQELFATLNDGGNCGRLTGINEVIEPHSFAEIADIIETQL